VCVTAPTVQSIIAVTTNINHIPILQLRNNDISVVQNELIFESHLKFVIRPCSEPEMLGW